MASILNSLLYFLRSLDMTFLRLDYMVSLTCCPFFRGKFRFSEIEAELDRRMSELRAKMLGDLAMQSSQSEWEGGEDGPKCPKCGAKLEGKGKKKRKLQTTGGREVEIEREYGVCPACGAGIFPPG
jgi:YgiT-type zinc finger domain-containing protein